MMRIIRIGLGVAALCVAGAGSLAAQDIIIEGRGGIAGRVVNGANGSTLTFAHVSIEGTTFATQTDLHGRYTLTRVPVGTHRVVVRLIGYAPKTVTGVSISPGEVTRVDITLDQAAVSLEGITVSAEFERGSAVALVEARRAAPEMTDAIGAAQISRSPDADAAQALKRVPGMSVVGDRFVYVRGLGDRYSGASLNGAPLPSPEPDRKAVPLDLFPASLLESVVTSKTYSPDRPGDYSGGLVDIRTKDLPAYATYKFSLGAGMNTKTTLRDGIGYPGGGLDFLGIDDGTRALPAVVPPDTKVIDALMTDRQLQDIGQSFSSVWQPRERTGPIDRNASLSVANRYYPFGMPLGFLAAATYSDSYKSQDLIERIIVTAAGDEEPETDYTGEITERTVRWSLFGKVDALFSPTNQLTVRSLYSRSAEDQARQLSGFNRDRNNDLLNYRLRFNSRMLWANTLDGDHYLTGLGGARLTWRLGYARATTDEPDRREVVYDEEPDGRYAWRELTNSGTRYFTALEDRDLSASTDLTIPLGAGDQGARLKFGGLVLKKDRDFFTRRFRYRMKGPLGETAYLPPDQLFAGGNISPTTLELEEDTRRTDNYTANQQTRAGYVMIDVPIASSAIRVVGGVRVEDVRQTVNPFDLFPLGLAPVDSAVIDNVDPLPAVNVTWSFRRDMSFRGAFSRTVARPQFREQAPFDFVDFAGGFLQVGNPALQRSAIYNYDLRWEWFPVSGSLVALSSFYKAFQHPIEAVVFPSSELIATWDNNEAATVFGGEVEIRAPLGGLSPALEDFLFGGNLTLVHSSVSSSDSLRLPAGQTVAIEPRERALQGQSPYVINASLTYFSPAKGTTITALYNRFGRRIDKVGTQVLPDVFEESRDQLDLVVKQPIGGRAELRFSATNLLDEASAFRQAGQLVRSATRGRSFSMSFSIGSGG